MCRDRGNKRIRSTPFARASSVRAPESADDDAMLARNTIESMQFVSLEFKMYNLVERRGVARQSIGFAILPPKTTTAAARI